MYVFELCEKLNIPLHLADKVLSRMQADGQIRGYVPEEGEYSKVELTGRCRAAMILNGDKDDGASL